MRDAESVFPATVSAFDLDQYEVTVGRFRAFVSQYDAWRAGGHPFAGEGAHPHALEMRWQSEFDVELPQTAQELTSAITSARCVPHEVTWTDAPANNEDLPMNCVTWYEAYAFCIWDGARLATEAEWAFAAAGGGEQRLYPWGETPPGKNTELAVYSCLYSGTSGCSYRDIAKVGSAPAGNAKWGHVDLAGSMREWVFDRFQDPYPNATCTDCVNATLGQERVFRGGSWYNGEVSLRTNIRNNNLPTFRSDSLGIRCARDYFAR